MPRQHIAQPCRLCLFIFFLNDPPTPEIYTLSLHDALPIFHAGVLEKELLQKIKPFLKSIKPRPAVLDRKSTRLNSSHRCISYAVFCLKKKNRQVTSRQERRIRLRRLTKSRSNHPVILSSAT